MLQPHNFCAFIVASLCLSKMMFAPLKCHLVRLGSDQLDAVKSEVDLEVVIVDL